MGIPTRQELLRRSDDLRAKQDARLDRVYRRSTIIAGAIVTVGGIVCAVAVSPATGATTEQAIAMIVFSLLMILANGVIWYLVNSAPFEWQEGPDVQELKPILSHADAYAELLDRLTDINTDHYELNEAIIGRLKAWVGIQAIVAFSCIGALIAAAFTLG